MAHVSREASYKAAFAWLHLQAILFMMIGVVLAVPVFSTLLLAPSAIFFLGAIFAFPIAPLFFLVGGISGWLELSGAHEGLSLVVGIATFAVGWYALRSYKQLIRKDRSALLIWYGIILLQGVSFLLNMWYQSRVPFILKGEIPLALTVFAVLTITPMQLGLTIGNFYKVYGKRIAVYTVLAILLFYAVDFPFRLRDQESLSRARQSLNYIQQYIITNQRPPTTEVFEQYYNSQHPDERTKTDKRVFYFINESENGITYGKYGLCYTVSHPRRFDLGILDGSGFSFRYCYGSPQTWPSPYTNQ